MTVCADIGPAKQRTDSNDAAKNPEKRNMKPSTLHNPHLTSNGHLHQQTDRRGIRAITTVASMPRSAPYKQRKRRFGGNLPMVAEIRQFGQESVSECPGL
ncbi:hypothetical protein JHW44_05800 [Paracoccus seriniphilus]|nr:hypothetical protein JHW44_05800 [Paracoccus seriniphilus]